MNRNDPNTRRRRGPAIRTYVCACNKAATDAK